MKTFNSTDCAMASNDRLIEAYTDPKMAEFSKRGILDEMRRRRQSALDGKLGYTGCETRFAAFIG